MVRGKIFRHVRVGHDYSMRQQNAGRRRQRKISNRSRQVAGTKDRSLRRKGKPVLVDKGKERE